MVAFGYKMDACLDSGQLNLQIHMEVAKNHLVLTAFLAFVASDPDESASGSQFIQVSKGSIKNEFCQ